ncbi:hydantoinase/oxoprolinase family protein [Sorangium sp. So ce295]|uniref:hydantoinase/oxoprolinase family protein n=1 Tax=Sorangium sp. So ce295 TaxID=3133295 RepID=UPI003F60BF93
MSASSEITREWREYERTSTTVLNAYVQPLAGAYLSSLESSLTALGAAGTSLHVMQSSGGITTFPEARAAPIRLVESGPAGSVLGAFALGQLLEERDIISLDIGGTTAKCAVLQGGEARVTTEYKQGGVDPDVPRIPPHDPGGRYRGDRRRRRLHRPHR